ncbi:bifunctional folylpolyglutamate synthase/dihydrofolate synthase [Aliifodinibius sp. S!AR15-10]|uniref:bifunctional folylpolyglutamate synthase/dihydrofolate synthase n=1 Tax=Aliifodinibius sp. S!AR15-10 TaxID=2950437 RepID=UPI00285AE974|nr:folylpolyglutamate synthase/dihydrofolate synthase family protein [Aliifodinibius sp. S!AR15-10]MDR8392746.1 bifunctional folylpolyglutamate synthase/dihydrofolate synthase [Aliifodinibius sp. S!AR15-10]
MKLNTSEDIYRFLDAIPAFQNTGSAAARFDLERFQKFCEAIGDPQDDFPSIHVAGTNGKGSTCQILGAIYHEGGYKTGLYTSPHLLEYRERFQVDGKYITDEELLIFLNKYSGLVKSFRLTYFELSTAIAFWWFRHKNIDLAIIEVGLGGRLDATNIITPLVSVITNISLDHTDILGEDIRSIAREKAGIIKQGVPVVLGNVSFGASEEVMAIAKNKKSRIYQTNSMEPTWRNGVCILNIDGSPVEFTTDLVSPIQVHNVALAWQVVQVLSDRYPVPGKKLNRGLQKVKSTFTLLGRFEKLHSELDWYFDGAHNLEAVQNLTKTVANMQSLDRTTLVLSLMKDKINEMMMAEFQKFKKIYYYTIGSKRAADAREIEKWLPNTDVVSVDKKQQTLFLKELESELVIFAGSFYFYSTVREWVQTIRPNH